MLLALLPWVMTPAAWTPNQGMFTLNRLTNDEVDVTAAIADNDTGPYVYVIPQTDFKEAPSVKMAPLGSGFVAGQWYITTWTPTRIGITKANVGVGTGTGGVRLFIKRPR